MKFTNLYDMHTHSIHSFDGNDKVSALCKTALNFKAKGFAVTDHCDIDGIEDYKTLCTNQINDLLTARAEYAKDIDLMLGIEVGQGIYRKAAAEDIYKRYNYDFVLASLHNLENMEDFYFLDYKQYDVNELLKKYFEDMLEIAVWNNFDSLAHLTYPLRYIIAREHIDIDVSQYSEIIDTIFETLIKNEKALEINTSGLFMDMKDTLPNISFIKRFKELGGKYITIGSDSHYADKLFQGIDRGMDIALKSGFDNITIFHKHNPILIEIK
ncbi:MAG: histidinol-phosphatase HisJ family protein [Acetobacter sp.]|nr:histidinol-phosphatase HisJ family protein [Bacteroides sp.]MCM1341464.1 histidinol-phosphatase HisJ family protein [Acetobacter sp.]MCM1433416.1 histidinol-phosphatase HisJ family protein [Clostridiales bacterium]